MALPMGGGDQDFSGKEEQPEASATHAHSRMGRRRFGGVFLAFLLLMVA
jgi:hypothetical protein